jgi:hypothetical protein
MDLITNPKIGFARYPGFSLLFDNPGNNLSPWGSHFQKINCDVANDPNLRFYKSLTECLDELGREELFATYRFFALPPFSYHVTVFDGLNQGNLDDPGKHLEAEYQCPLEDFLVALPESLCGTNPFTPIVQASPLVQLAGNITFEFDKLSDWGSSVLVARLKTSQASQEALRDIRRGLYERFDEFYPTPRTIRSYNPHVSLGYFGNDQRGTAAALRTDQWTNVFRRHMQNKTITFSSISLYGFTDMVTFFK